MGILFLVVVGVLLVWAILKAIHDAKIIADQNTEFIASHKDWDVYASAHSRTLIAIDQSQTQIVLGPITAWKQYKISQISSVEILRDGATISSTNRGSQAAGALIGGLALGGVGLLLGGLSGSKRNTTTLHSVAIKVIVDDRQSPVHVVEFFKSPSKKGTDARSAILKPALEKADRFHALLVNALRTQQLNVGQPRLDSATELQKLWDLKLAGALTDQEFVAQKAKLLAVSDAPPYIPRR